MSDKGQAPGNGSRGYDVISKEELDEDLKAGAYSAKGIPTLAGPYRRRMVEIKSHLDSPNWEINSETFRWSPELEGEEHE